VRNADTIKQYDESKGTFLSRLGSQIQENKKSKLLRQAVQQGLGEKVGEYIKTLPSIFSRTVKEEIAKEEETSREDRKSVLGTAKQTFVKDPVRFARGIAAGAVASAESLARFAQWEAEEGGKLVELAQWKMGGDLPSGQEEEQGVVADFADALDEWKKFVAPEEETFLDSMAQGVGSAMFFYVPGLGVQKGVNLLTTLSPRVASYFGTSASAFLEAAAESGSVWNEAKKNGKSEAEASTAAFRDFMVNAVLVGLTNRGLVGRGGEGQFKAALKKANTEGFQELFQQITSNLNVGRPWDEGIYQSWLIGAITGPLMDYGPVQKQTQESRLAESAPLGPGIEGESASRLSQEPTVEKKTEGRLERLENLANVQEPVTLEEEIAQNIGSTINEMKVGDIAKGLDMETGDDVAVKVEKIEKKKDAEGYTATGRDAQGNTIVMDLPNPKGTSGALEILSRTQAPQTSLEQELFVTPRATSDKFWSQTYDRLPPAAKKRFHSYMKEVLGVAPGDVVGKDSLGRDILAPEWREIAQQNETLGANDMELVPENQRSLLALMEESNKRYAPKEKKKSERSLDTVRSEIKALEEQIEQKKGEIKHMTDLSRFKSKKTGELPEVGKGTSRFAREGDSMATELGFEDSEALRENQVLVDKQKEELNKMRSRLGTLREEMDSIPQRERGFLRTVRTSDATTQELKAKAQELEPRTYEIEPNKESLDYADALIKSEGVEAAEKAIARSEPASGVKAAIGLRLSKMYEEQALLAETEEQRNALLDKSLDVVGIIDPEAREYGRYIQMLSNWKNRSPAWTVRSIEKTVEAMSKEAKAKGQEVPLLSDDQKRRLLLLAKQAEVTQASSEKSDIYGKMADVIGETVKPEIQEYVNAYRYSNILSGPQSQLRNAYGNSFMIFVTRPFVLAAESAVDWMGSNMTGKQRETFIRDVPAHYRRAWNALPEAVIAFKEALRSGELYNVESPKPATLVRIAQQRQIPKYLTIPQRYMLAADKFGTAMLSAAEEARLIENGVPEVEAREKAIDLAERYLFRNKLDYKNKDNPLFDRAVDSIGQYFLTGKKTPFIGPVISFLQPFITMPLNWVKWNASMSALPPFGLVGGKITNEKIARVVLGTFASALGGVMAAEGLLTAEPPEDEELRKAWYDAGNKRWSVKIGDAVVPMLYFGPFFLSLALPAAIAQRARDSKEAPTDSVLQKIGKTVFSLTKALASQTPLAQQETFFKAISGDIDYTTPAAFGFATSQMIPAAGINRYVNKILDPIYRRNTKFTDPLVGAIPGGSRLQRPALNSIDMPAERDTFNLFLPYDIGVRDKEIEKLFDAMLDIAKIRFGARRERKEIDEEIERSLGR
jgi:hypothetical protein